MTINKLERTLYQPLWIDKIEHLFSKNSVIEGKLDKENKELNELTQKIKEKGDFISEETDWLNSFATKHSEYRTLSLNVTKLSRTFSYIEARNQVANHLNNVADFLKEYKENNIPSRKSRQQVALDELGNIDIPKELEQITALLNSDAAQKISKINLPSDFENLPSLEQFRILTKMTFPLLDHRIDHIVNMIKDVKLEDASELQKAIKMKISLPPFEEPKGEEEKVAEKAEGQGVVKEEPKIAEEVNTAGIAPEPPPLATQFTAPAEPPPLPSRESPPTQTAPFAIPPPPPQPTPTQAAPLAPPPPPTQAAPSPPIPTGKPTPFWKCFIDSS